MAEKKKQWYNNKELFEMVQGLGKELIKTQSAVKEYNSLVVKMSTHANKLDEQIKRCDSVQAAKGGRVDVYHWFLRLWPVALSLYILLATRYGW